MIKGISFSIDQADRLHNEPRIETITDATEKAELYAKAVSYTVKRIITISKQASYPQPPMPVMMRMQDMAAQATPITTSEVSLVHTDNAVFELTK